MIPFHSVKCKLGHINFDSCALLSSEDLSRLAARKYARVVQKLDFPVSHFVVLHYESDVSFPVFEAS